MTSRSSIAPLFVRFASVVLMGSRPSDRGFNSSSQGDDDLPELAAVLQIAVHFRHIVELERTIDDRLERATRKALDDVFHRDLPACLVARYQRDVVSFDGWHL